jgi:DNA polymerase
MLSTRQLQCLQGIGVRCWGERDTTAIDSVEATTSMEPVPAEAPFDTIEAPGTAFDKQPQLPQSGDGFYASVSSSATNAPATASPRADVQTEAKPAPSKIEMPGLDNWDAIDTAIEACTACELAQNCTRKVPGIGNREADLLIVGEGPGQDEDLCGEPFVGRSGQLLDRMLAAIGFSREQVYITNIVKCRPPSNRDPRPDEALQCRAYLDAQIKLLAPKVILSAGRVSAHNLLGSKLPVGKLIKQMHQLPGTDIPLKVTYHPAYLLRNPAAKAIAWQDMKLLYRLLQ